MTDISKALSPGEAIEALTAAVRREFNDREYDGDTSQIVKARYEFNRCYLKVNVVTLHQMNLTSLFSRMGQYGVPAPVEGPDVVHLNGNNGELSTRNFTALKDALNQKFLSPKNQITFDVSP